jgi:hypothetical protein
MSGVRCPENGTSTTRGDRTAGRSHCTGSLRSRASSIKERRIMFHDDFGNERYRLERVLDILERASGELTEGRGVPVSMLRNAVGFIRATEDSAYISTEEIEGDPPLAACVQQHVAARVPLDSMERSLAALDRGHMAAVADFARAARQYIDLRRAHLRSDDRLFLKPSPGRPQPATAVENVETATARRCYERLIEEAAALDAAGRSPSDETRPVGDETARAGKE